VHFGVMVQRPAVQTAGRFLLYYGPVKISAAMAMWACVVFGLVCLGVAYSGFTGLQTLTDPVEREASLGYAWFWTFLFLVAAVFGVLSWMMKTGRLGELE
jgi:hypothetical protein